MIDNGKWIDTHIFIEIHMQRQAMIEEEFIHQEMEKLFSNSLKQFPQGFREESSR